MSSGEANNEEIQVLLDDIRRDFDLLRQEIQELHREARFYQKILNDDALSEDMLFICGRATAIVQDAFLFSLFLRLARVFDKGKYSKEKEVLSLASILDRLEQVQADSNLVAARSLLDDQKIEALNKLRHKVMVHIDRGAARSGQMPAELENGDVFEYLPGIAEQVATCIHRVLNDGRAFIWGYVASDDYTSRVTTAIRDAAYIKRNREWLVECYWEAVRSGDPTALNLASIVAADRKLVDQG